MSLTIKQRLQITAYRASWSIGLPGFQTVALSSQLATARPASRVKKYESVEAITEASAPLVWTNDPWDGRLDVIKHPTYMQEAIDQHPQKSGDCDDFATWWIAALIKGGHVGINDVYFAGAGWYQNNKYAGHACCVFQHNGAWNWVSNWHRCQVKKISTIDGWIAGMEAITACRVLVAGRIRIQALLADDTVIFGAAQRCR